MKYLVLALCVCAASAATTGFRGISGSYNPKVVATPVLPVQPVQIVAKTVVYKGEDAEAPVLRSESKVEPDSFSYIYETGNGISAQASGSTKKVDDVDTLTIQGSYQYQAPDGTPVQFTYVADENGYQPKSDLLPVGPEIPAEIARALEYLRTHAPIEEVKKY